MTTASSTQPTPSLSESGTLPTGVTFTDNGNGTATLSGTPAAGTGGIYSLTLTASNGVGSNATQPFTLTVDQAPAITSAASTTFTVGSAGSFTVTTASSTQPTPSLSESGTLPTGVTFTDNGNGTATLSGTPAAGTAGVYNLTVTASNGVGSNATQAFTLTVDQAPAITSTASTTFTVGSAGSFTVTTSGYPNASLSESGTLPTGVTFTDNGNGTATLSGTPAAGTGGVYSLTLTASNGVGSNATQPFTLTVDQAPAITSAASTTFTVGTPSSFTVTTSGYPNASLSESGTLPTGVTFTDNGNGTASLSGTPAAGTAGVYSLTLTASNGVGSNATQAFTLTVAEGPSITSAASTTFLVGAAGSFTVTTSGFPTPSLSESGTLPTGVTFTDNGNGTATLAGTPAAGTGGSYDLLISATNGVNPAATQAFTLTVEGPPVITSASSAWFNQHVATSITISATGYPTPLISRVGPLPNGLSFENLGNGTATVSGATTAAVGTYSVSFTAWNGNAATLYTQNFTFHVGAVAAVVTTSGTMKAGVAGSVTVKATGSPTPSLAEAGTLPVGVTFHDNGNGTGTLSGTPQAGSGGSYGITITAANGTSPTVDQAFTLVVNQAPAFTSANRVTWTPGQANSFSVTTDPGYPGHDVLSLGPKAPTWVSLVDNGNGTGTLSGTPPTGLRSASVPLVAQNGYKTAHQSLKISL